MVWGAAILGDQCNYLIGRAFGKRIVASGRVRALTPERIRKTEEFLDKWGSVGVFLGRFFPFIRTFVPFFAGIGAMKRTQFTLWNVMGALAWSSLFVLLGFFFGGLPFVRDHFEWVVVGIVAISLVPVAAGALKALMGRRQTRKRLAEPPVAR